jgi:hypothetical protein
MARDIDVIWLGGEENYFCKWDWTAAFIWTANFTDLPVGQPVA